MASLAAPVSRACDGVGIADKSRFADRVAARFPVPRIIAYQIQLLASAG
jgi:hypothetical protein